MKLAIFALLLSAVAAFVPVQTERANTVLQATDSRREFLSAATAAVAVVAAAAPANAIRDYENIALLGGSEIIDVNNANVRVYLKLQGMYPGAAGKIVSHGPYESVSDLYKIPGISDGEKAVIKRYEARFTTRPPSADYVIDRINNGLYR
uniref:Photosystem II 12 kDa extrinsic protein n=1 Tax=Proboscia inermis TaxID=420281 RepID=A0A7S0CB11_9STRA|mmetsp:Transcript_37825/g.38184  ORF Transcript_37825/g.38184 Transcript_37825/m.38184 type:complete len:150 (+) Transcript_37825:107-556(+)|eukprot:CAMPEP_0171322236 /NCGR_PEP_ID=MMETSP0816-20121228/114830_1 /TAXON_ID=420281 /ORGANISM="Proboscia inermis, Strain CCAP1064/1" /LENGTH=149 /DNA_ID=CAMNT_0011820661 /DNA_START=433 /DNA_END=882 /DNA_ORIENTATION=-